MLALIFTYFSKYSVDSNNDSSVFDLEYKGKVNKIKILFLCTGNSCRSQMAEGFARHLKSDYLEPYSAGIETHGLNEYAVKVMAEIGINIASQESNNVNEFVTIDFDYIITVCGHAHENCPITFTNSKVIHVGFDDPPKLAIDAKTEDEALDCYRRVRDEIRNFIESLPKVLEDIK